MDEEFKKLIDYARGGAPAAECGLVTSEQRAAEGSLPYTRPVPREHPINNTPFGRFHAGAARAGAALGKKADVIPLAPPKEPSLQDEILQMLEELATSIRDGRVLPCHLIMGWGEAAIDVGEPATRFIWDTTGLTRFELIGHLQTYACKLVNGEGE